MQAIITLILATDMARHGEILDSFKHKVDNFDFTNEEHVICVSLSGTGSGSYQGHLHTNTHTHTHTHMHTYTHRHAHRHTRTQTQKITFYKHTDTQAFT